MARWKGARVFVDAEEFRVETLCEVLDSVCNILLTLTASMRVPNFGICTVKGVGDTLAGRAEQGVVKPVEEVCRVVVLSSWLNSWRAVAAQLANS